MQKCCIWETGNKIPQIDCIKLRCKNSASGKLNTKYLKLTASSYSLSQNCRDTVVSSRPPQCWCPRFGDWIAINSIGREKESTRREKNSVCFQCPYQSCIFVWDCRFITWMTARSKKRERKKRKKKQDFWNLTYIKRPGLSLRFQIAR